MYRIFDHSNNAIESFESFKEKMIDICNEHRKGNRALAFAFILYDFNDPQIARVLNQPEYWHSLDKISGKYLTVFSFHYNQREAVHNYARRHMRRKTIRMMSEVNIDLDDPKYASSLMKKYFPATEVTYPAMLFFQVDNKVVTDAMLIELKEKGFEESFQELQEYIQAAVSALKDIEPGNKENTGVIFDNLEYSLRGAKGSRKFKRVSKRFGTIIGLAAAIKGLF